VTHASPGPEPPPAAGTEGHIVIAGTTDRPALLGSPLRVGRLQLRNRIVGAPMERNYGTRDGRVTERYIAYLRARAAGGVALLFTEATYVRADGRGRVFQLGAHADHVVPGLRELCDAVHAQGALLGVELNHAGRVAEPHVSGFQPVAPTPVPYAGRMPRELSTGETAGIVHAFAAAARRCVDAGADVVGLHAAHGYLIHQFLSPRTNQRTDRYADPVQFVNEVIVAVRDAVPGVPLVLRLSAMEGVPGGLDAAATLDVAARMRLDLIDVIDIQPVATRPVSGSSSRVSSRPVCWRRTPHRTGGSAGWWRSRAASPPATPPRPCSPTVPPTSSRSAAPCTPIRTGHAPSWTAVTPGRASPAIRDASTSCTPSGRSGAWSTRLPRGRPNSSRHRSPAGAYW
jgi:2,4-dienoyl-CoA reductase-like NADH-dependent reductase (Old Yellow Enzyme family)